MSFCCGASFFAFFGFVSRLGRRLGHRLGSHGFATRGRGEGSKGRARAREGAGEREDDSKRARPLLPPLTPFLDLNRP